MREARVERKTTEVDIVVELNVDGRGKGNVKTGIKFLDHLLTTLTKHSLFDLKVKAKGELKHHVCEDVALALGEALNQALADKKGIRRFGSAFVPMDDSLARAVVDLGGRPYSNLDLKLGGTKIENLKTEDIGHFIASFAQASKLSLHLTVLYGTNEHHKIEAATKALAIALREAVTKEPRMAGQVPSAKGVL
ncbi:MAG: imidazoleglycerol-phosphate dehydratase HisB [Candidatus Bathyarchaeota archaeon]|nr:imidazoleglycerol-phosphate dehydratase HisB [Candidatus Bathyarchaeota archaeon]MDH5532216.1 imidazoleglycerol-phosphate dehydratase HisB [Candidatus Bathyarchaeota archaeon]MDH5712759.1 imidazoleglycerol-phosphate dehydratase HisB [Candidatus Bathyarchaeota archaeon]